MSDSFAKPDRKDWWSVMRHTIMPLIAGAILSGVDAFQNGGVDEVTATKGVIAALLQGVMQILVRWGSKTA